MPRRLPTFGPLVIAALVGLFALPSVLTAQPPATPTPPAEVQALKAQQENLEALTNRPMSDPAKLAKTQAELAKKTQELADKMAGKKSDGNPDSKSGDKADQPKSGEKPGHSAAEPKPD